MSCPVAIRPAPIWPTRMRLLGAVCPRNKREGTYNGAATPATNAALTKSRRLNCPGFMHHLYKIAMRNITQGPVPFCVMPYACCYNERKAPLMPPCLKYLLAVSVILSANAAMAEDLGQLKQ